MLVSNRSENIGNELTPREVVKRILHAETEANSIAPQHEMLIGIYLSYSLLTIENPPKDMYRNLELGNVYDLNQEDVQEWADYTNKIHRAYNIPLQFTDTLYREIDGRQALIDVTDGMIDDNNIRYLRTHVFYEIWQGVRHSIIGTTEAILSILRRPEGSMSRRGAIIFADDIDHMTPTEKKFIKDLFQRVIEYTKTPEGKSQLRNVRDEFNPLRRPSSTLRQDELTQAREKAQAVQSGIFKKVINDSFDLCMNYADRNEARAKFIQEGLLNCVFFFGNPNESDLP
jgi:hypothetical protein